MAWKYYKENGRDGLPLSELAGQTFSFQPVNSRKL
jgi:hypothetical protein